MELFYGVYERDADRWAAVQHHLLYCQSCTASPVLPVLTRAGLLYKTHVSRLLVVSMPQTGTAAEM